MTSETWKDIPGWEGIYQVSDFGRVRSFRSNPNGRILSRKNKIGSYIQVILSGKNKKPRYASVHRLVAESFLPNPNHLPQVNHKDGNRHNNRASNLEWCTGSENIRDMHRRNPEALKRFVYYTKYKRHRRVVQMSIDGIVLGIYPNAKAAQMSTGVSSQNILAVAGQKTYGKNQSKRKTAGGFVWRFESEVTPCNIES